MITSIPVDQRLAHHLALWLGQWPAASRLDVVGSTRREQPGWDGAIHPVIGVGGPQGTVLSVPPRAVAAVAALHHDGRFDAGLVPTVVGLPDRVWLEARFRWCTNPAPLPDVGQWVPADAPDVPSWLRPFGGEVLVARDPDSGAHLAGVGIKRHDAFGNELAVVTAPEARGRGLARRLVAQATRRVLDEGAVATYIHAFDNTASARTAQAAGFPDQGWSAYTVGRS